MCFPALSLSFRSGIHHRPHDNSQRKRSKNVGDDINLSPDGMSIFVIREARR